MDNQSQQDTQNAKKKAKIVAIVASSDFNEAHFMNSLKGGAFASVIAVDAGYRHLDARAFVPNIVIGDFDSLGYVPKEDKVASVQLKEDMDNNQPKNMRIMQYPKDKDKTDLELAIDEALSMKAQIIFLYGALGNRLDMTYSTTQMMAHIADHRVGVFCVGDKESCVMVNGPSEFGLGVAGIPEANKTISVFSVSDVALIENSIGLRWPYINTALTSSMSLGVSNEVVDKQVKLKIKQGKILLVFSTELLLPNKVN